MNPGLQAYLSAAYYSINSKFTLKVSVYEYFIKFGDQTKKQPFKGSRSWKFYWVGHLHMCLVQLKKETG